MSDIKFKTAGFSNTSSVDNKRRKEVKIKAPKCWIDDYEHDVNTDPYHIYSHVYDLKGKQLSYTRSAKYKIYIPLASERPVLVEVSFNVIKEISDNQNIDANAAIATAEILILKEKMANAIERFWNRKLSIKITDPLCGERTVPIEYSAAWVESGENFKIILVKALGRESISSKGMTLSVSTKEWTMAHEYGHCVGLPDEYSNASEDEIVKYVKPNGEEDLPITIRTPENAEKNTAPTIMSTFENSRTEKRHAWQIAIEAQKILTAHLGRKIKCDIV